MEATEVINPNGSVERTITLNEAESRATLERLDPTIRAMVEERLGQNLESLPATTQMSAEELERICDEAVGIYSTEGTSAVAASDTAPWDNQHLDVVDTVAARASMLTDDTANGVALDSRDHDIATDFAQRVDSWDDAEIIDPTADDPDDNLEEFLDSISTPVEEATPQDVTIPLANLNTTLTAENTARFSSAEWFEVISNSSILIGGVGGIGSWLAMLLARTNVHELWLFDDDKVEAVNLAGQFFGVSDIGKYKVEAVTQRVRDMANLYRCNYSKEKYTRGKFTWDIMMCGFDNMDARRVFFDKWQYDARRRTDPSKCLFLDGRLSAETLQVYCIQGDDTQAMHEYMEHCLFSDDEADHTVCSYKQTSFMANMIAGTMVNLFVNWSANQAGGFRPVPFFTEYDAVTMQYKIKMSAV